MHQFASILKFLIKLTKLLAASVPVQVFFFDRELFLKFSSTIIYNFYPRKISKKIKNL